MVSSVGGGKFLGDVEGGAEFGVKIEKRVRVRVGVVEDSLRMPLVRSYFTGLLCDSSRRIELPWYKHCLKNVGQRHVWKHARDFIPVDFETPLSLPGLPALKHCVQQA